MAFDLRTNSVDPIFESEYTFFVIIMVMPINLIDKALHAHERVAGALAVNADVCGWLALMPVAIEGP